MLWRIPPRPHGSSGICRRSGRRSPPVRATRVRCSGGGSRPRSTRCAGARMPSSKRRRRRAARTCSGKSRSTSVPKRSPSRPTGSPPRMRSRRSRPSGKPSVLVLARTNRPRGTFPHRVRSLLHPPARRSRAAEARVVREPREEGSALRARGDTRRVQRLGGCGRGAEAAAIRVEDDRAGWKNKSELIWHRFRAACDRFFERQAAPHRRPQRAARRAGGADRRGRGPVGAACARHRRCCRRARAGACCGGRAPTLRRPPRSRTPRGQTGRATEHRWRPADAAPARPETHTAAATAEAPAPPPQIDRVAAVRSLRAAANAPVVPRDVLAPLAQRFEAALARSGCGPDAVRGTEFDVGEPAPPGARLACRAARRPGARTRTPSPRLGSSRRSCARRSRPTIGGRADDESKVRAAEQEIRQLQTSWSQVGFVPDAQVLAYDSSVPASDFSISGNSDGVRWRGKA